MSLTSNQQLFEYRIEHILGRGAFGTVYLAHDTLLDRPVAVKELTVTAQTDEMAFKRFLQEARAAGGLNSPHIVTVHALKMVGPEVYLVTEYLAGGSLRARLEKQGRLPVETAVRIAAGVCEGLAAAHAKGIIHRDIKPENVLLTEDGRAKVGDFGIAHVPRGAGGTSLTQAGFQPGTLLYMSPEQIRGQPVDGRSDVYQVGALLYEMLVGRHYVDFQALERQARETAGSNVMLFQARLYELLDEAICVREPEDVCRVRPDAPEWVGEAVAAALAKEAEERPTTGEMRQALRQTPVGRATSPLIHERQGWPEEWPMVGGNASHVGWDGVPVHIQSEGLRLHWTFQAESAVTVPAVARGIVFVGSADGHVYALDAITGEQRWSFFTDERIAYESIEAGHMPVIANDTVFIGSVGSGDGHIYALDIVDGQPRWAFDLKTHSIEGLAVADETVFVASWEKLYALNIKTGEEQWSQDIGCESLVVAEQMVFAIVYGIFFCALDAATGETLWVFETEERSKLSELAVVDGVAYVGSEDGVYAVETATGQQRWAFKTKGQITTLTVANGIVFAPSLEHIYALDMVTGEKVWASKISGAFVPNPPAVAGEVVFVGTCAIAALFSGGDERLGVEDLFALDRATGRKLWALDTGYEARGPSVAGGVVFVGSDEGKVYALGGEGIGAYVGVTGLASAEEHFNHGTAYVEQGRLNEAIREYQAALNINPSLVAAHAELGVVYKKQGRLDEALREYQIALRINPNCAKAHDGLSVIYREQNRPNEARREAELAHYLSTGDDLADYVDLDSLADEWGYESWSDYEDTLPD